MKLNDFHLRCELVGHSMDVRGVTNGPEGEIVSVSRDQTTKIWRPEGTQFIEGLTMRDHTKFVNAVCVVEKENWICTGSNDQTICVYKFGNLTPFMTLKGHEGNVCCLAYANKEKSIISGSWDKKAKVWTINETGFNCITIEGHDGAVWAVCALKDGRYVTGGADKMICIWNSLGSKLLVLKGHTDCVRGLAALPEGHLLSCSNDGTIRLWSETWECIREFHGHSNYIYTISLAPALGPGIFLTGSEDSTIRLWSVTEGALGDAMMLPAQSIWSVCSLANGDLVAGCSDATIRIFTSNADRMAIQVIRDSFQLAVESRRAQLEQTLGGVKITDLPGPEALVEPGKKAGQTKMIRQPNGSVMCYQWQDNQWACLGEVTGASGGSQKTSGKTLYEGIEYDYVFTVDIEDGKPALKLPYNLGEDPWAVAQTFIHKHGLPQAYLEQVANFIVQNSESTPVIGSGGFGDPFTGGNRYVPGAGNNSESISGNADPFTGDSSYTSGSATNTHTNGVSAAKSGTNLDPLTGGNSYTTGSVVMQRLFPLKNYHLLDNYDADKILLKLKEFNIKVGEGFTLPHEKMDAIIQLLTATANQVEPDSIRTLKMLYSWPSEFLFPVLDVTRLLLRDEEMCKLVGNFELLDICAANLQPGVPVTNKIMATRCLSNMITNKWGRGLFDAKFEQLVETVKSIKEGGIHPQNAISTFYYNISVALVDVAIEAKCNAVTEATLDFLNWTTDNNATLRSYQALGNMLTTAYKATSIALIVSNESVMEKMKQHSQGVDTDGHLMMQDTAQAIIRMLGE